LGRRLLQLQPTDTTLKQAKLLVLVLVLVLMLVLQFFRLALALPLTALRPLIVRPGANHMAHGYRPR
jgi:hypothetical protein